MMPVLPVETMTADFADYDARLIRAAFTKRGECRLRTAKPYRNAKSRFEGEANYLWRMLCFDLVAATPHSCMPVCADFDMHSTWGKDLDRADRYDQVRSRTKELDDLVERFCALLPVEQRGGLCRWGRIMGAC